MGCSEARLDVGCIETCVCGLGSCGRGGSSIGWSVGEKRFKVVGEARVVEVEMCAGGVARLP